MRLKALTCEVFARATYMHAAMAPHVVDVELVDKGLHDRAATLRETLQARVDAAATASYDAVVLVYGLCNRALEGVTARHQPLVLPRAHDCITLYLGSRRRYEAEFNGTPGTFYYSDEYLERGGTKASDGSPRVVALGATTPISEAYDDLVAKYGEDNAAYLLEVLGAWRQHYQRAAYVELPTGRSGDFQARARQDAAERGWRFERLQGDLGLIRRLLWGEWDDDDFLVVPPGQQIAATYDAGIVAAEHVT